MVGDGEFIVVNKYLVNELSELGLWNEDIRNQIVNNEGSVQDIQEIPNNIQDFENIQFLTSHLEAENPFRLVHLGNLK